MWGKGLPEQFELILGLSPLHFFDLNSFGLLEFLVGYPKRFDIDLLKNGCIENKSSCEDFSVQICRISLVTLIEVHLIQVVDLLPSFCCPRSQIPKLTIHICCMSFQNMEINSLGGTHLSPICKTFLLRTNFFFKINSNCFTIWPFWGVTCQHLKTFSKGNPQQYCGWLIWIATKDPFNILQYLPHLSACVLPQFPISIITNSESKRNFAFRKRKGQQLQWFGLQWVILLKSFFCGAFLIFFL